MNWRAAVVVESVLLAAAGAFLLFQIATIWPAMSSAMAVGQLEEARRSGGAGVREKAAKALLRHRPDDGTVHLILGHALLAGGKPDKAASAYAEAARRSASRAHRAAAEVGRGTALLLKSTPPEAGDLAAAREAFRKALGEPGASGDAQAMLAVAEIWAGDLEAAGAAAEAAKGVIGLEPSAALACAKAYLASAGGDASAALLELCRARLLAPGDDTPVGKYVSRSTAVFELEAATRPGASTALRAKLLQHLQAEGPRGISEEATYPLFYRAALSCAKSDVEAERRLGMDLLARAAAARPEDPMLMVATATALVGRIEPVWRRAEDAAQAEAARKKVKDGPGLAVLDVLPGGAAPEKGGGRASKPLEEIDKLGAGVVEALHKAAAIHAAAGDGSGAERAVAIFGFLFAWRLRAAELSTDAASRRRRELEAAAEVVAMAELLGESTPRTEGAARLLRNAGATFARYCAWDDANACFQRSLGVFPEQPDLKPYAESMRKPPRVVAVHPAKPDGVATGLPLVGAEFALPEAAGRLQDCKVEASVGTRGGEPKSVTPVISGTGLWYVPKEGELPDGLVDFCFAVTDAFANRAEARVSFRVDNAPPEITSRFPEPDAVLGDARILIRIGWKDPSGVDPESVQVVLEPVTAKDIRRPLVENGKQKQPRFTGEAKWNKNAPVIPDVEATQGSIVTGKDSDLKTGTYRVRVRMRDRLGRKAEEAWQFTIR